MSSHSFKFHCIVILALKIQLATVWTQPRLTYRSHATVTTPPLWLTHGGHAKSQRHGCLHVIQRFPLWPSTQSGPFPNESASSSSLTCSGTLRGCLPSCSLLFFSRKPHPDSWLFPGLPWHFSENTQQLLLSMLFSHWKSQSIFFWGLIILYMPFMSSMFEPNINTRGWGSLEIYVWLISEKLFIQMLQHFIVACVVIH